MKKLIKKNWIDVIKLLVVFVFLSYVSIAVSNFLRTDDMQERIKDSGIIGPFIVILYVVLSHIFAPVAGTPGTIIAFSAYGLYGGWIILYVASLISAATNFYISRQLGRSWVKKLAGEKSLNQIDNFAEMMGIKLLKIARIFGAPMFEFISYAAGFTRISFRRYMLVTIFYSIVPGILFAVLVNYSLNSVVSLSFFFATMFIVGALFSWYTINKYLKFQKKKN